jgi:CheY-like chemotaxis protein
VASALSNFRHIARISCIDNERATTKPPIGAEVDPTGQEARQKMRFLAVDDDPLFLQVLAAQMDRLGYSDLQTASSGASAISMIQTRSAVFDCILLDVQMPEMDGISLCRKIRSLEKYSTTPIVMITSMSDRSYIDAAFDAGATDYITKPLDRLELKARIGMVAQLHKASRKQTISATLPLSSYSIEPSHDFADAIVLPNVERMISYVAMTNYLLTLGLKRTHTLRAFAVQVENAYAFYPNGNHTTFIDMIGDVASAILESLKTEDTLFAYAGSGIFVCIVRSEMRWDMDDISLATNLTLSEFFTLYEAEELPRPFLHFGSLVRCSAFTLTRSSKLPEMAIAAMQSDLDRSLGHRSKILAL